MRKQRLLVAVVAWCSIWWTSQSADAALIITLESVTPFQNDFDYRYSVSGPSDEGLLESYFTLIDIPGLVTVESLSPNWRASGGAGSDPSLRNVTFSYQPTSSSGSRPPYPTPTIVGLIRSTYSDYSLGSYVWQDKDGYPTGNNQTGTGSVNIPAVTNGNGNGNGGGTVSVPEPDTMSIFGAGLLAVVLLRRRHINQTIS